MCYSALVAAGTKKYEKWLQTRIDRSLMEDLFDRRANGEKIAIGRAIEANFADDKKISKLIDRFRNDQITKLEQDLFAQKKRLANAERALKDKPTKKAQNDKDVSERQIKRFKARLERLQDGRVSETERIYAFDYAPVVVMRNGKRMLELMRYHLRPFGMNEDFDRKYPGCYNARRDSLTGFWKRQFGTKHAVLVIEGFYENVKRHNYEGRKLKKGEEEENVILHFSPKGHERMYIPCIFDEWKDEETGKILTSFALITDEPPKEVSEAGHDRCPIFLKESRIDDWLNPNGKSSEELFEILDDRERPFYAHEIAA